MQKLKSQKILSILFILFYLHSYNRYATTRLKGFRDTATPILVFYNQSYLVICAIYIALSSLLSVLSTSKKLNIIHTPM